MIGRVIKGKYKIYEEVGSGGFATVYVGRNLETNEMVAIKVLSEQFTREPRYVERFRREAGLAERLRHRNVVRILDHGIEDGTHFLIMEFVEGLTFDTVLERRGRLAVEEVISYLKQICAGLQAAHEAGVVHRDIKPANLMLTPDGSIKIMDFGIARMESAAGLTQSGMFMGTPRYISPEMARGVGADIRSDLYALGLLAYEMLTGAPPFDADNPWAVLRLQIEEDPPPLRQAVPDVPSWLEGIIKRATAKDPDRRFQIPNEMLAALEQQTPQPRGLTAITARPLPSSQTIPGARVPVRAQKRGSRGLVLGLAAAALVLVLGVVAAILLLGPGLGEATPTPPAGGATSLVQVAQASATVPPSATPVILVVTSTPEPTLLLSATPPPPSDMPPPASDTPLPEPSATASSEPTATVPPSATAVPPTKGPTDTPAPTPTPTSPPAPAVGGRIAYSAGGTLHIVDVATGGDLVAPIANLRQPNLRADGGEVLVDGLGDPATIVNVNARSGGIVREQTSHTDDFHPFWSPDGSRFVYDSLHHGLGQYTMLYTQSFTGGKPQPEVTLFYNGQQIRGHSPVWMHDDWIAFSGCDYWPGGSGGSKCGIYRIPSWSDHPSMVYPGDLTARATDNDGGQLLVMSQESGNWEVYIMSNQGGAARNLSDSAGSQDGLGTFSPDGKLVAFASNRGGPWAVWVVGANGTGLNKLFDLPGAPGSPWTEDSMSWGP